MRRHARSVSPAGWSVIVSAVLTVLAAAVVVGSGPEGLALTLFRGDPATSAGVPLGVDPQPPASLDRVRRAEEGNPSLLWTGLIWCERSGPYRFRLTAGGRARLAIDGADQVRTPVEGSKRTSDEIVLSAGPHLLAVEYLLAKPVPSLTIEWDRASAFRFESIAARALAPTSRQRYQWRLRALVVPLCILATLSWGALMVWAAAGAIGLRLLGPSLASSREMRLVLLASAVVFVVGVWWGLPGAAWAPDELEPEVVLDAWTQHFSRGWFDRYPPFHYYVLGLVYALPLLAQRLHVMLAPAQVSDVLFIQGRLLSSALAVGTVAATARLASEVFGDRYAWPAALTAGAAIPFAYYAKTVNLDMPYVFWFSLSLIFLARLDAEPNALDAAGLGLTSALSVATKDQAYGLYVLPALYLAWKLARSRRSRVALATGSVTSVVTLVLAFNVVFNYRGFLAHVDLIRGPASEGYRMFPPTLRGQWVLARTTAGLLAWSLGIPGMLLVGYGLVHVWRRRAETRLPVGLLLAPISYYLTFIALIGYIYDRFLLPVTTVLALIAAVGLRTLLDAGRRRKTSWAAAAVAIGWLIWRAVSVDALLIRDSRYAAERWLRSHVQRDQTVASINQLGYIPRLDEFNHVRIPTTRGDTLARLPDYIVFNTEFARRFGPDTEEDAWVRWLESGASPYEEVYRHKTPLTGTAFAWTARFLDRGEDPFSNLDKVNPEIAIFRRRR